MILQSFVIAVSGFICYLLGTRCSNVEFTVYWLIGILTGVILTTISFSSYITSLIK